MKKIILACLFALLFCTITNLAQAKLNEGQFLLSTAKGRITLQAENASVKKILAALEEKTGLKVVIYEGVPDRKVTLKTEAIPIYAIGTLLKQLSLRNTAIVYEEKLRMMAFYVLPEGMDPSTVLRGKMIILPAKFPDPSKAIKIKGKSIITTLQGKNKVPIRYVDGEILLKFHRGVTKKEIDALLSKYRLEKDGANDLSRLGYLKVRIGDGRNVLDVVKEIRKEHKLKVPEPNYIVTPLTITDPLFSQQWYVPETRFDAAWDILKRRDTVPVAVIDTGVNANHPDLKGRVLKGYDFVNGRDDAGDDHGHGTFVAGIIAASANDIGIRGLYDQARIIPVKAIDNQGLGTYEDVAQGIAYAADAGARVINLSIGGYAYSYLLQDAVDYALEKGCILVAAGGNDGIEQPIYPAAYPDVIGVSALSYDGQIWSSSNSGKHIDVTAPGTGILSTGLGEDYVYATGTSASAAMVSALAAMLVTERSDLSSSVIELLIMQSAKDLGEKGRDKIYGSGEIDAKTALGQVVKPFHDVAVRSVHIEPMVFEKGKPTYIVANIENTGTYISEKFDVVLYEIVGEARKEIGRQGGVNVIDKTKVIFEWNIEGRKGNVRFEVSVVLEKDLDISNNLKITNLFSIHERDGLYVLYANEPPVHQWIAYQAYNKLSAGVLKSELASYLDTSSTSNYYSGLFSPPSSWTASSDSASTTYPILEGAWEEDEPFWRSADHFWDPDSTYNDGILGYDSALKAAQDRLSNAIINYNTNKGLAYWWLGRTAHLLMDMSVPAHAMKDWHANVITFKSTDSYEQYTKYSENYKKITYNSTNTTIPNYITLPYYPGSEPSNSSTWNWDLSKLLYNLAEYGDNYDSDNYNGESNGGAYNYWPAKNDLDRSRGTISKVEKINFWGTVISILSQGTHYEIHKVIDSLDDEIYRIFYYQSFYNSINNTTDGIKVTYSNGSSQSFYNLDEIGFVHEVVPSSVLERIHQVQLESRAIGYVAALYQLFWDKKHGMLSITTTPVSGAVYVDGVNKGTGSWSDSVATGSYTISFGSVSGYTTPANQTVTVNNGQTTTVTGTYILIPQSGTLSVATTPVSGGITVDGTFKANGSWSGSVATGSHTVSFGAVSGYTTPANQTVTVNNGQTTTVTGTYVLIPQSGTLSVTTTPVSGGITVDGAFKANGSWSGSVSTGSHTISFGTVSGYTAPLTQTVTVSSGQTTTVTGTYTTPTTTIEMSLSRQSFDDYGTVTVGQSSDKAIIIQSTINSSINLTGNVSVSGTGFSIVQGNGSFSLAPGASTTVMVRFSPTSQGASSGTFTITHNATNRSTPISMALSGTGSSSQLNYTLTVTKSGTGMVSSNPAGISCGSDCSESYASETSVSLTATPDSGWSFGGWGGSCSGTGSCTVSMTSAKSVSATFTATSTLYPSLSSPVSVATDGGQLPRIKKWGNNIYVLNGDNNRNLMFYKSTDNGTTFASTILATPVSNSYEYEFSMDTNGCLYAIWESANDSQMYIRRSLDGGITWSSAASVANGFGWMDNPSGYFSNGTLFLLFRGWKNSKIELYLTRSTDYGNTFSTPVQVTDNTIQENTGKIAVFGNNVYVVYFDWDSANTYLVTSLNGGSSFGSPIQVNRTSGKSGPGSSVGVDLAGNIFVVYSDTTSDGEGDLYVAKSANGGSSFTYALAADSTYRQQEYPRIFIDANDYVNLLWNDNRDNTSYGSVYYTRSVDGGASYEANVNIRSSGGISNGSLYVDSGIVNIVVTDYKTSPFSTIFYRLTWLTDTAPVITSAGTASGTVNQSFTYLITATNSPTSYAVSGLLPAGLSVNQSTGLISGMPTASGTFNVTVNAANAGGTGSKTVTITIAASISIIPGDLNNDRVVDLADAILGLQITGGIKPVVAILKEADVNGDNKIGIEEVIYILQFIAGLRSNVSTTIPPGTVQGRVLWNEQPVTGATVYATDLYSFDSTKFGSAVTGSSGLFSVAGIPAGEQYLYVFGNQPEFWVTAVTPFQMISGNGTLAADSYLCKGFYPISPQQNETIYNARPLLQWPSYPDAVNYAVRIIKVNSTNFVFQRGDYDARITQTSEQVDVDLVPGTYRWRVDAFNSKGNVIGCSYSLNSNFTVNSMEPSSYKLVYVSGNNQTYGGGGMPYPMVFNIFNPTTIHSKING